MTDPKATLPKDDKTTPAPKPAPAAPKVHDVTVSDGMGIADR